MELLKLLLVINLIFVAVKTVTGKVSINEGNYRIDRKSIELIRYDIELITYINEDDYKNIDIYNKFKSYFDEQRAKGNFIFQGQSTMFFRLKSKDVNRIHLHIQNLIIDEAATEITYSSSDGISTIYKPRMHEYDKKTQTVILHVDDTIPYNFYNYRLIMKFVGRITDNTGSFFKISYINNKGEEKWFIAAADFHGAGAREIFPCWDEPDIKTNFTISMKHNHNLIPISNSPIDHIYKYNNVMSMTRFKTTYNISLYQVAVVLSEFDFDPRTNTWCRQNVRPQLEFARKVAENATLYLKDKFFEPQFPSKVNHIVVPGFRDEGLESWGLVLYRETDVMYDKKLDSIAWKFEVARKVARKIVHQFFCNLIGQSWWSYMWLNEGIASFLATKIVKKYVHSHLMDLFAVQFQYESLRLNDYYDMPLVSDVIRPSDINSLFSFTYYVKAPAFIRVLEQTVSPSTFEIGLDDYLNKYQLRSIDISTNTADKFFDLLQATLLPYNHIKYANLKKKLSEWPKQKRYPVLEVTRESSGNMIKIKLSQDYVNETYGQYLWTYVTYTTQSRDEDGKWLSPHNPHFHLTDINKNDWIIVNVRQAGYYRVNYDYYNWEKLMKYLNSEKYHNIHVLNRAQIIDDAYYFLLNYQLDVHFFKSLTYYLSCETNYVAWYPMFKIMEELSVFFPFPESTEIKEHFQKILESVLKKIGYTDNVKEDVLTECLRQEAAKWACNLNSLECTASADLKLTARHTKPLSPVWKEWTYCKGLMSADDISWNEVLNSEVLDNNLLRFLACTKNHTVIIRYLDLLKSGRFIKAQHRITAFHSIIARHARNDLVLDHIINNFSNVVPREIKTIVALIDIINHLYSEDQLDQIYNCAQNHVSNKIFSYVIRKINIRSSEITLATSKTIDLLKTE
ncbi:glutamyl aminopeptidase-like [Temnothorax longispinosus]|uniref:glutamyl aminopeptidase-like n=1 Tax=Temnothorax longispinosus TaxID=300112 RepID=UPI003A9A498B